MMMTLSCRVLVAFTVFTVYFTAEVTSVDFILVADFGTNGLNGTIYRAPMADLDQFVAIPLYGLVHPSALDYNPVTESIYWSDYSEVSYTIQPSISRANLDGTGQVILQQGTGEAAGLTVDHVANEIYWTETDNKLIKKASSLGPSGFTTVVSLNLTSPHDIAVDPIRRELYWTDWGQPDDPTSDPLTFTVTKQYPKIEKSNLDGTNRRILIDGKDHPGIVEPYGITLDFENELLYFCDPRNNSIYLSDLHGYGLHNLVEIVSPEIKPYDIAFYGSSIIWTDSDWPALIEIERYQGLYAQLIGPFIFSDARGIYINTDTDLSCESNPCQNGGLCRQFVEGYECVCSGSFTGDRCEIQSDNSCMSSPCLNHAECNQLMVGFTCLCKTGFSGTRCEHINLIIIADIGTDKIYTASVPVKRGSTYEEIPIPNNTTAPKALDFDPVTQRVFWSDNFAIQSINLDGSDQQVIIDLSETEEVQGLALDTLNRKLYWTDIGNQTIQQSDLDGSNRKNIISNNMTDTGEQVIGKPWNIIVDPAGGFIYWTDVAKEKHLATIERARLDGSDRVTLLPANLFEPVAIQADFSVGQLFIGDALVNRIETCDLDGRNRRVLIQLRQTDANPFDIGLYQNILYWSDSNLSRLVALNRYGSTDGALLVGPATFNETGGMVIYEESDGSCDPNPCNQGRCRQLPLGYQCVCTITRNIGDNCEIETDNSCGSYPCQNGARCDQKVSGYECVCLYGFSGESCDTEDVLYIADQSIGTIYKAPLRTLTFKPILENLPSPTALRYDLQSNCIYWTDNITKTIECANATDGSDRRIIVSGLTNPGGLSIDRADRKLYWSDIGDHSINRIDMDERGDGAPQQEVFIQNVNLEKPQHIVVDWRNSRVYWTNWQDPVRIERMFTNKTGRETVINATDPNIDDSEIPWMVQPSGINIDYSDEILYWGDLHLTKISTFDLNTGEQRVLVDRDILTTHLNLVLPYDVVSYNEYIYWTDPDNTNASLVEINRRWPVALSVGSVEFGSSVGLDISTALPACWSKPCKNEGNCYTSSDQIGSYFCICTAGYTGVHCQTEINECLSSPCVNDSLCQDKVGDYSCFCFPGYTGKNCETDIDECDQVPPPCLDEAICTTPDINDYFCDCPSNICGKRCDLVCPPACNSIPCQNGATCLEPVPQSYICICAEGFNGTMCETEIPTCESNPCQNGGTCSERGRFRYGYDCTCSVGYDGENCETDINYCIGNDCMQGSECIDGLTDFTCNCVPGFTGNRCGDNIYECDSNPCQYGGTCHDRVNHYVCDCAPFFIGLNCETPTRDCGDITCMHGGECYDRGGGFVVCVCDPPYTGPFCEVINACVTNVDGNPCQNGGTCSTFGAMYTCACNPGWIGASCEIATDECSSTPCQNGGTCIDQELSYACECTKDWKGADCTETVRVSQACNDYPSPCQHGSTCEDTTPGYIYCRCTPGYVGEYCQINIDECLSLPCQNGGFCTDKLDGFKCQCRDPYIGDTCEKVFDKGCRFPTFPGFLYPEKIWYPRGSRVTYLCPKDYTQKGATDAVCKDDGWSEIPPECVKLGANTSDPATAVGIGIGISIVVFLIILIILAIALFLRSSRREPAPDEVTIVGYSNQQAQDGTGFGEVHIGLPNNDMHAPVDSATVPDDEPIIKSDE